jgi:hypothetical protein
MTFTISEYRVLVRLGASDSAPSPLIRKLRTFGTLPVGWSHGEGIPVSTESIRIAEQFVNISTRLQLRADVFPGLHGECAVAFYQGQKSVEVIIRANSQDAFGLHVEDGHGFDFTNIEAKDNANHAEVIKQILQLVPAQPWKSLASSTSVNLMATSADFRMLSSNTPQALAITPLTAS